MYDLTRAPVHDLLTLCLHSVSRSVRGRSTQGGSSPCGPIEDGCCGGCAIRRVLQLGEERASWTSIRA